MQRTLNYTGRSKIKQTQALFSFSNDGEAVPEFNVAFNFRDGEYPENASVFVEAYYKETRQRFAFGTFGNIIPPENRRLDQIDLSGPTLFRVLIVDESGRHGMLLASGEQFRADTGEDEEKKNSLLPVSSHNLGQVAWRVHLEPGSCPELHVNSQIPDAVERMKTDPGFQSLILPAAFREILTHYLWNDDDSDGDEHCARWMAFAEMFADANPDPQDPYDSRIWIDEVISGFSERFHLTNILIDANREDLQ